MDTIEYIDPQLLFDTSHLTESSTPLEQQAEFSFTEYLFSDTDDAMAQQHSIYPDFEAYAPYSEFPASETYSEVPLLPPQPDPQPGFDPGYTLVPCSPWQQFPYPQYTSTGTQTYTAPMTPQPVMQPAPLPKRTVMPKRQASRYCLRSRAPKSDAEVRDKAKANEKQGGNRADARAKSNGQSITPPKGLTKPLSKLAPETPGYKELDMEAFVRRSADHRIVRGKIGRPANAFILYRKAYGCVAGSLASGRQANISRIVGASWKMETQQLRDYFHSLSHVEKVEHMLCFPSYKYIRSPKDRYIPGKMAESPLPSTLGYTDATFEYYEEDVESEDVIYAQPY
ncbi:hypothetical protein CIB48_g2777 [Xylaria polymorpha]|nr:hypothetical protein CIB48_g2777 [Xylaria polymorpha]